MKSLRSYTVLVALALEVMQLSAQQHTEVELSFSMDHFRIISNGDSGSLLEALEPGYFYPEEAGSPVIPLTAIRVLVPAGARWSGQSVEFEEEIVMQDLVLYCASPPVPTNAIDQRPSMEPFTGTFPEERIRYNGTMIQRGFTWFSFIISPFRYDSRSGELSLTGKITLEIEYTLDGDVHPPVRYDPGLIRSLRHQLVNPGELGQLYPAAAPEFLKSAIDRVDYLVVTTRELEEAFAPLLEWKRRKGLKTDVITLEEIEERYSEPTIQLKIKRCLHDYYLRHNLRWVLLGGDAGIIPVQGCYGKIIMQNTEMVDASIPADLFYACFDQKFDWNSNVDEKIGQIYFDNHDLVPEIFISRFPVRDVHQVRDLVGKTLVYERDQPLEGFSERILLSGVKSWNVWEGKSDSHHRSDLMFHKYINKTWQGKKVGFFDTGTDFESGDRHQVNVDNLSRELNEGYGLFHFAGHGNNLSIVMESGSVFDVEDAGRLSNPVSGIILSNACDVSAFDSIDPCLGEAFLRNPSGGGVAFFGSARFGFGNPNKTAQLGPSLQFNASFLKHLFDHSPKTEWKSFATMTSFAKTDHIHNGGAGGTYHYLLYALNALGDPELPIYTARPFTFDQVRLYRMGNSLTVHTGGVNYGRICITSLDLEDGFQEVVEGTSFHTFEEIPEAFQVTITAPNHIPYIFTAGTVTGLNGDITTQIRIYPNPANGYFRIDLPAGEGTLQLFDTRGLLLQEHELIFGTNTIDVSQLRAGTYLLRCTTPQGVSRGKVVVQPAE